MMSYARPSPQLPCLASFGSGLEEDDISVAETISSLGKAVLPGYLLMANRLMKEINEKKRIRNSDEFAANLFIPLYETVTGRKIKDAVRHPTTEKEAIRNLELLLSQLSSDLKNISLSHIRAEDLMSGDTVATYNLLEILQGLTEYTIKRGRTYSAGAGDEDNLSTFRSEASTILPGNSDDEFMSNQNTPRLNSSNPNQSSGPSPLYKEFLPEMSGDGQPLHHSRSHLSAASPVSTRKMPALIETASEGSSISGVIDDDDQDDIDILDFKDTQNYARLKKKIRHAEKRADRVGLIAQLLANCALFDRIKARNSRRALSDMALDDNISEISDMAGSIDHDRGDDILSIGDEDVCGYEEEMPGMSLTDTTLRRLQKFISPTLLDTPSWRPVDQFEKHRKAAERRLMVEANRREFILSRMVRRELAAEKRLRELAEKRTANVKTKMNERNSKIASARANRYAQQMVSELKGVQLKAEHSAEKVMREALAEGSRMERHDKYALDRQCRDEQARHASTIKDQIESLENLYHDQFCELTESAKDEKESIEIEARAKKVESSQMKNELRRKLESDIRRFQETLRTDADDALFFRRLDAERALDRRRSSLRRI